MGHLRTLCGSQSLRASILAVVFHLLSTDDVVLLYCHVSVDWPDMSADYHESFRPRRCSGCSVCISGFSFPSKADSDWNREAYKYTVAFDSSCLGIPGSFEFRRASGSGDQCYNVFRLSSALESIHCYPKS